jgi:flavin reductase (DIM6/NTAB) family NADH-FMN oxidoreductase RutF
VRYCARFRRITDNALIPSRSGEQSKFHLATIAARPFGILDTEQDLRVALRKYNLSKVYQLLEPGPAVLLTTASKGRSNVMTMSWHMMVEFEPPLVACVVSEANFSFGALRSTGEAVIAIPTRGLADKVVKIGNCSGRNSDKFKRFGLTPVAAGQIRPPLIKECFCNLECRVKDTSFVKRYNLFILEVLKAWIDSTAKNPKTLHHRGYGSFVVDGAVIKLKSKMRWRFPSRWQLKSS